MLTCDGAAAAIDELDQLAVGPRRWQKSHLISIIDDDPSVRMATQSLVRSLGYTAEVFFFRRGIFAIGPRRRLVLCDHGSAYVRGMSGTDLQDRLMADGHQIPIIFLTAYFEERTHARIVDAGAVGFLRKPFADERLIECLDRALSASA